MRVRLAEGQSQSSSRPGPPRNLDTKRHGFEACLGFADSVCNLHAWKLHMWLGQQKRQARTIEALRLSLSLAWGRLRGVSPSAGRSLGHSRAARRRMWSKMLLVSRASGCGSARGMLAFEMSVQAASMKFASQRSARFGVVGVVLSRLVLRPHEERSRHVW